MPSNVSIATRPLVYSTFRYISNKVWNALAEYIDNSIQSFLDHQDVLSKINPDGIKLRVSINMDFENDTIIIEDNAFGITEENYQRAFELANIPLDNKGLNEFGMGMKVSSIWLSNVWKVETTAYGDDVLKTVTFDLNEVVENEELSLPVTEESCDKEAHFTRITLSHLSGNKPTPRQLSYIKKHLASIYTLHLRKQTLELIVNDEPLEYKELTILNAPKYNEPNGKPILWKKDINLTFGERYAISGFIALLDTMSTSIDNGFLLFRRRRVIGSSYDERYRPKELCGQEGSPLYKRVFGELYLTGFDVSFTKNSFQEDDDFAELIKLLREDLNKDKTFDLFAQGQHYTKPRTQKEIKNIGTKLVKQIISGFTKPIVHTPSTTISTPNDTTPKKPALVIPVTTPQTQAKVEQIKSTPTDLFDGIPVDILLDNNEKVELTIKTGEAVAGLYTFNEIADDKYEATINLKNNVFQRFASSLSTQEGQEQLSYMIEVMVASEISMIKGGSDAATKFRSTFNNLFGTI